MHASFDESADEHYFVLSAVICEDSTICDKIVDSFRSSIRKKKHLTDSLKSKVNNDPKESFLHRHHPKLLIDYIDLITRDPSKKKLSHRSNLHFVSAYYEKRNGEKFTEDKLLHVYQTLFIAIVQIILDRCPSAHHHFVYDQFPKAPQMKVILSESIQQHFPDLSFDITYASGEHHKSLLIADIITGTTRRKLINAQPDFFHKLKPLFLCNPLKITP